MLSVGEQPHVLNLLKLARYMRDPVAMDVYGTEEARLEIKVVEPPSPETAVVNTKTPENTNIPKYQHERIG